MYALISDLSPLVAFVINRQKYTYTHRQKEKNSNFYQQIEGPIAYIISPTLWEDN